MKLTPPEHPEDPTNQPTFERLYICLGACKRGFVTGCRSLIGLGGCHLKAGQAGQIGQLLCAVGIDANNQMFPVAYAVVEGETKSSWLWFIQLLIEDIGIENQHGWTFITCKQKGLIPALEELVPHAEHRNRNQFKGKAGLAWQAGSTSSQASAPMATQTRTPMATPNPALAIPIAASAIPRAPNPSTSRAGSQAQRETSAAMATSTLSATIAARTRAAARTMATATRGARATPTETSAITTKAASSQTSEAYQGEQHQHQHQPHLHGEGGML